MTDSKRSKKRERERFDTCFFVRAGCYIAERVSRHSCTFDFDHVSKPWIFPGIM